MIRTLKGTARTLPLLLPVLLAACGGDSNSSDATTSGAAVFSVKEEVSTSTATVGDRVTWTVTATNSGTAATTDTATLLVNMPTGLTGLSVTTNGASCGAPVSTLTCTIPSGLAAGSAATVIFSGTTTAASTLTSSVRPTGVAAGDTACESAADCSSTTVVAAAPVVTVAAAVNPTTAIATGAAVTWTLTATNSGGATTSDITLTDTLPSSGIGSVTVTPTNASCGAISGNTLTCTIPSGMAASGTASVAIATTATAAGTLTNTVTPSGTGASCASSATCTTSTTVVATVSPSVSVSSAVNKTSGHVGDTVQWTLTATNSGTGPTTSAITLTDTLPTTGIDTSALTVTGTGATCGAVSGGVLTCTVPSGLAAGGGTASVVFSGVATAAATLGTSLVSNTGSTCTSASPCTTSTAITVVAAATQIPNSCGVMIDAATLNSTFGGTSGSMVSLSILGDTVASPHTSSYLVGLASTGDAAVLESWTVPGTPALGSVGAAGDVVAATGQQFVCASENGTTSTGSSGVTKYTSDLVSSSSLAGNIQVSKTAGSNGFVMFNLPSLSDFSFEYFRAGTNTYILDYSTDGTTWHNIQNVSRTKTCPGTSPIACDETNLLTAPATNYSANADGFSTAVTAAITQPLLLRLQFGGTGTVVLQKVMIKP